MIHINSFLNCFPDMQRYFVRRPVSTVNFTVIESDGKVQTERKIKLSLQNAIPFILGQDYFTEESVNVFKLYLDSGKNPNITILNKKDLNLLMAVINEFGLHGQRLELLKRGLKLNPAQLYHLTQRFRLTILLKKDGENEAKEFLEDIKNPDRLEESFAHLKQIVNLIIDSKGIDINARRKDEIDLKLYTALDFAMFYKLQGIAGKLIDKRAEINLPIDSKQIPLLTQACKTDQAYVVQKLLEKGACVNINQPDQKKSSPIYAACENHSYKIIRLLHNVAEKEKKIIYEYLYETLIKFPRPLIDIIHEYVGTLDFWGTKNIDGQTPLHALVSQTISFKPKLKPNIQRCFDYVLANIDIPVCEMINDEGRTPIVTALMAHNVDMANAMIKKSNR